MNAHAGAVGADRFREERGISAVSLPLNRVVRLACMLAALSSPLRQENARGQGLRGSGGTGFDSFVMPSDAASSVDGHQWQHNEAAAWSTEGEAVSGGEVPQSGATATALSREFRWHLAVDALLLWQGNAQSQQVLLDSNGSEAFNTQDLQTEAGAGVRVGLIRDLNERISIEGNYFQARPFNANGGAPQAGGPYELTNTGDLVFNDISSAVVASSGWIQSAELNWRKQETWSPITWLAGFRWVELNSQTNVDYAFENPDPFGSGSINTGVGNNLYGAQLGADMRLFNAGGKWRLNGLGKAGVFYNAASYQRSTAGFVTAAGDDFPLGTVAATADQTAFFGEVGLTSTYWITRWLAWRAGYTVLWASGVAVAAEQLPLNSFGDGTATINTESSVLLHGVTTGIEARW